MFFVGELSSSSIRIRFEFPNSKRFSSISIFKDNFPPLSDWIDSQEIVWIFIGLVEFSIDMEVFAFRTVNFIWDNCAISGNR
uniref:Uncharacterized protein n=1 Tax=Megaselia scalaris TaxID=36166 RepID=T1GQS5_MEGSC